MNKNIGILNYGLGNLGSVFNALKTIGFMPSIIESKFNLNSIDYLIVPGVGSFDSGIRGLINNGYDELIKEFATSLETNDNFKSNSKELEKISRKLEFFKTQTATIFKNYRSKVSAQTKMHRAYKRYSG